jgi:hypothetical protein
MKIAYSPITNNFYEYQGFQENIKWVMQKPVVLGLFIFQEKS